MNAEITVGSWNGIQMPDWSPPFLDMHKSKLITGVALFAISTCLAGGLLLYFKVNTIAAWSLVGVGGGSAIFDLLLGLALYRKKTYLIVSWNVGTLNDYSNMCFYKNNKEKEFSEAYKELHAMEFSPDISEKEKAARMDMFRSAFQQFGHPDIICLQETWQMDAGYFQAILPTGYSFFSYKNDDDRDCTVVWNSDKFTKLDHATLTYDARYITSTSAAPDTIILLRDIANGTTICVGSTHLRGFSLAYDFFETEEEKSRELEYAKAGDHQTRYDLETMALVNADLYIFAGDFNVTPKHYPPRFDIIAEHGYVTDETDIAPTIYDANLQKDDGSPMAIKLDHIFVKGGQGARIEIQHATLARAELNEFENRPSDHLPIAAQVGVTFT